VDDLGLFNILYVSARASLTTTAEFSLNYERRGVSLAPGTGSQQRRCDGRDEHYDKLSGHGKTLRVSVGADHTGRQSATRPPNVICSRLITPHARSTAPFAWRRTPDLRQWACAPDARRIRRITRFLSTSRYLRPPTVVGEALLRKMFISHSRD